jgi:peptidoglycan/LPS O-acetylase OafA/YrhL
MLIAVAAQTQWRAPRILRPLLKLGERSYEVYLTHIFVVLGAFSLFVSTGKQAWALPLLFLAVILVAGFAGEAVARGYSEPINRWLRRLWKDDSPRLGSVVENYQ